MSDAIPNEIMREAKPRAKYGEALRTLELAKSYEGDECFEWPHHRDHRGYGRLSRHKKPSRMICEWFYGPPPDGKPFALHSCDNPPCINKRHLRWGSHLENMQDVRDRDRFKDRVRDLPKGTDHHSSRLTPEKVIEIRNSPLSNSVLGRHYGVNPSTISRIRLRETWAHV